MRNLKSTILALCCLLAGVCGPARAAQAPLPPELENPKLLGINKEAPHATLMPFQTKKQPFFNLRRKSHYARDLNGQWKFNWVPRPEERPVDFFKPDFDVSQWKDITVPSNWQLQGYGTPIYLCASYSFQKDWPRVTTAPPEKWTAYKERNPVGSYRRDFEVPEGWNGRRIFITFDGVDSAFFLWINGQKVGYSTDSRTPAEFDITKYVKPGKNVLAAEVYRYSCGSYLEDQDMWFLSGIYRNVTLWSAPVVHVRDFFAKPDLDAQYKDGTLEVTAKIKNYSEQTTEAKTLKLELLSPGGMRTVAQAEGKVPALAGGQEAEVKLSVSVKDVSKWTAETPELYTTVLTLVGASGNVEEYVGCRTGFRKVEIKGRVFTINGVPVKLKGANRHENWPDTGHYVTEERMIEDLKLLKHCNSNTVRTSHYSDDPRWYELCDEWGVYLVAESNVECHGYYNVLDRQPEWRDAIVGRELNSVQRDKNHAAAIIWSLGNECGGGDNFRAAVKAIKEVDPTRPVHYEPFGIGPENPADIDSQMYPTVAGIKKIGESKRDKPYFMCEYAHAMSNSMGSIGDYNDMIDRYEGLMGGCIWEWQDQSLWNRRDPANPFLAYGGGFGDFPNNSVFILKGVVFADRTPTPKYAEVKKVYQWLAVTPVDLEAGKFKIHNKYSFTNLSALTGNWALTENGQMMTGGRLEPMDVAPLTTGTLTIPLGSFQRKPGAEYLVTFRFQIGSELIWARKGDDIASEQFILPVIPAQPPVAEAASFGALKVTPEGETAVVVEGANFKATFDKADGSLARYRFNSNEIITDGLKLNAYRAPHLNDDLWAAKDWKDCGLNELAIKATKFETSQPSPGIVRLRAEIAAEGKNGFGFAQTLVYTVCGDGTIAVDNAIVPHGRRIVLPRIGMRLTLDRAYNRVHYFGRGPSENYADRKRGSLLGFYASSPLDSFTPYSRPMDCGNHEDARWMYVCDRNGAGLMFIADGAPFSFAVLPFTDAAIEKADYPYQLPKTLSSVVCLSAATLGVGSAGCGHPPLEPYRVYSDPLAFSFVIRPVPQMENDILGLVHKPLPARVRPVVARRDAAGLVSLESATQGAKITYSINGGEKRDYTGPFELKKAGVVSYEAAAAGCESVAGSATLAKFVDHSKWKATASSFANDEEARRAIDGNPGTWWHTRWQPDTPKHPHWLAVDFGAPQKIAAVTYLARQDQDHGRIRDYELYLSADGKEWGQAVAKGRLRNDTKLQTIKLAKPAEARYLKLVALSEVKNQAWASVAELDIVTAE